MMERCSPTPFPTSAVPSAAGTWPATARALRCDSGHAFDVARQGYAGLLTGEARTGTADTAAMVAARAEFLDGGHFAPLARAGRRARGGARPGRRAASWTPGRAPATTSRAVLDRLPGRDGVALDLSKHALRRAARAHPRVGALTWDVWRPLPVRTGAVAVLLDVFAPRNGAEFHRVLRPDGILIVVTPAAHHLGELVDPLGLLTVDARKADRVADTLWRAVSRSPAPGALEIPLRLTHAETGALAGMGPERVAH